MGEEGRGDEGARRASSSPTYLPFSTTSEFSIRVNDQWRICFGWRAGDAHGVEIVDYPLRGEEIPETLSNIHPGEVLLEVFLKPLGIS